jgi:hypothetical protein
MSLALYEALLIVGKDKLSTTIGDCPGGSTKRGIPSSLLIRMAEVAEENSVRGKMCQLVWLRALLHGVSISEAVRCLSDVTSALPV